MHNGMIPKKLIIMHRTIYDLGINKAQGDDYITAIKMINEALKIEPKYVDAYFSLAGINANMKEYSASVTQFEKAFALDAVYTQLLFASLLNFTGRIGPL